jgi:hypothetical protein
MLSALPPIAAGSEPCRHLRSAPGANIAQQAVAIGLSLGYLGLSFQNLAIVAGALSVGIGFGLTIDRQQLRLRLNLAVGAGGRSD